MDSLLSDFDSFSESSSSDYQDDAEFLYDGQACSIMSSLEETLHKIDDFLSFEREFLEGDIVCLVTDPSAQMGRVVNVDMVVDLENTNGIKIRGVNSKEIIKIRSISIGDYVVKSAWLGKVEKVVDFVTVLFDDGTKSEFSTVGPEKLIPISQDTLDDSQVPFYPGQRVYVQSSVISHSSRWLCGMRKGTREKGTVCSIDARLVYIDWLDCVMTGSDKMPAPPCLEDSKDLTRLSSSSHANWQVGDWCMLPITESDLQEVAVIVKARTKVDILWQDGTRSYKIDSQSLFSVNIVDAHDFMPEQLVLEKGTGNEMNVLGAKRWGFVKSVDAKEKTVNVRWITSALSEQIEETVSAYELIEHPDYSFSLGDAVFKIQNKRSVDLDGDKKSKNETISQIGTGEATYLKCVENGYTNSNYSSCIGIVIGFEDGNIHVKWASGGTSMVSPYDIYKIDKCEGSSFTSMPHGEHIEQSNERIAIDDNQSYQLKAKEMLNFHGGIEDCEKSYSSYSLQQAATEIFSSITSNLFHSLGSSLFGIYKEIPDEEEIPSIEEELELSYLPTNGSPLPVTNLQTIGETNTEQRVKEAPTKNDCTVPYHSEHIPKFRQFDMVSGCSDHHFVGGVEKGLQSSQVNNGWLRKVQHEWSILEKDLPDTIYVRVYEERMDLLRAGIIGASGTPYHDGLFFFDIYFLPEYPREPPMVYYNSGGLRLNPNLYESGKVCLSLLNTWTGSASEVWNPASSTILQVLLSLQALVLNEQPYFNEAGYDTQIGKAEGEKNSVSYNENAFLMNCKSMLYILHKPPKHFEALVDEHFGRHGKDILSACKAYMDGAPVGSAIEWNKIEQENQKGSSKGFKIMLAKLFPGLVEAFSEKGINCC